MAGFGVIEPPPAPPTRLFHHFEVGVDRSVAAFLLARSAVGLAARAALARRTSGSAARGSATLARLGVELARHLVPDLGERFAGRLDLGRVAPLDGLLQGLERAVDARLRLAVHLVAQLLQVLLGLVSERVAAVLDLDLLAPLPILLGVRLGVG